MEQHGPIVMMRKIRLELARCHEYPEGSALHGYELHLPLQPDGTIDREGWSKHKSDSDFLRFWGDEEERGRVKHARSGWRLSFGADEPDEVIFRGDDHRFAPGEYVSIAERDGVTRTFKVAAVH
jgi:hypothetical protein